MKDNLDFLIAIGAATTVMAILSGSVLYYIIIYRRRQRAFEQERESFKQALLKAEIEIKEQTLSDISRELHDNLGQVASLIKINLNLIQPNLAKEDSQKVSESLDLLKQLIKDIKSLSVSLKAENLERFGLLKMIEKDIERYEKTVGLNITFATPSELPQLEQATQIFLYRMSQEIFNNIIKHANATQVSVSIMLKSNSLLFSISDDGRGFNTYVNQIGSGLQNIKERCQIIGAELDINSKPEHGTSITIDLKI